MSGINRCCGSGRRLGGEWLQVGAGGVTTGPRAPRTSRPVRRRRVTNVSRGPHATDVTLDLRSSPEVRPS